MTIGPAEHVRIVLNGNLFNQEVQNVMHFEMAGTGAALAENIAKGFWDWIKSPLRGVTTTDMNYLSVDCYDNDDPAGDFGTYTIPSGERLGTYGLLTLTPNSAYGMKLNVGNRTTKPGATRFAGVRADAVGDGGYFDSATNTLLNTLAATLITTFTVAVTTTLNGRLHVYGAPHPASLRYPARETAVYNKVEAVVPLTYFTTQNTRKYGRGS